METLLPGITLERVPTSRLTVAVLSVTDRTGPAVLFVHGNVSSSLFWQPTMLALPSPYRGLAIDLRGFGGTDPEFVERLAGQDRGDTSVLSPRQVLLAHYVKPPYAPEHLDIFVESMLSTRVGEDYYPGDSRPAAGWPGFAPGDRGVLNTMAPTHFRIDDLSGVHPKPPVLWLRGADDVIVSDTSLYDLAYLGSLGAVPGWPGAQAWPPQPMVAQTRGVLDGYAAAGGRYREVVIEDSGHGPHLDQPERFLAELAGHLGEA